jgi:hypothetical protein
MRAQGEDFFGTLKAVFTVQCGSGCLENKSKKSFRRKIFRSPASGNFKNRGFFLIAMVSTFLLVPDTAGAEKKQEFRSYPIYGASVESSVEGVKTIVGEKGRVLVNRATRTLVVLATPERHAEVVAFLEQANRPVKSVRIEVRIEQGAFVDTGYDGMSIEAHADPRGSRIEIRPGMHRSSRSASTRTRQSLLVSSGREGVIEVGRDIPFREWIFRYGRRFGYFEESVRFRFVGARLVVSPTVIGKGPEVLLSIVPEISMLDGKRKESVRFVRAATEIRASHGVSVSLGDFSEHGEFYDRFLAGRVQGGKIRKVAITVTPYIVEP